LEGRVKENIRLRKEGRVLKCSWGGEKNIAERGVADRGDKNGVDFAKVGTKESGRRKAEYGCPESGVGAPETFR